MASEAESAIERPEPPERWGLVAAGSALMAITSGVWYSASVFFLPLLQEFRSDYASTAGVFSLFIVLYGVSGLLVGDLVDRVGARRVVLAGGLLLPIALLGNSLATGLGTLYLSHSVLAALGLSATGYVPVSVLVTRGFRRRRGLALGVASAGVGLGIFVLVPLIQILIDRVGWRLAYAGLAVISAAVTLPVGLFALRERGGRDLADLSSPVSATGPPGWTLTSAVCSREFWLISATFTLLNSPVQLVMTHHVAHLVEVGQPQMFVAGLVGAAGFVSILGKISWGFLSDRWWIEFVYALGAAFLVAAIGTLLLVGPATPAWVLYAYPLLVGLGYAVSPAMTPILCGRFFSGRHFGAIFGALNILYHAGAAAGVWAAGRIHDVTGSYRLAFLASIISAVAAPACVWLAAPRRVIVTPPDRRL